MASVVGNGSSSKGIPQAPKIYAEGPVEDEAEWFMFVFESDGVEPKGGVGDVVVVAVVMAVPFVVAAIETSSVATASDVGLVGVETGGFDSVGKELRDKGEEFDPDDFLAFGSLKYFGGTVFRRFNN